MKLLLTLLKGEKIPVHLVECSKCKCRWMVRAEHEHQPSYCTYCGIKFKFYEDLDGELKNIAGFKTVDEGDVKYENK